MNQDAKKILKEQEKDYIEELTEALKKVSEQLEYLIEILE